MTMSNVLYLKNVRSVFFKGFVSYYSTQNPIRVRFAPSPTGFLHLGGLHTALYNFLFGKLNNGKFLLRIEDTDQTRLIPGAIEELHKDLRWAGIDIDEGPGLGGQFGNSKLLSFLHLGGLRTALYNFLFAKLNNGKFLLRIEDTDQTRLIPGAIEELHNDLRWAGIEIDEGPDAGGQYGPYIQSQRIDLYRDQIKVLIDNGSAYPCFCTERRLDLLRKEALKMRQVPKYDNKCRHLSPEETDSRIKSGENHCIRFKLIPDCETFEDMIYGNIAYDVAINEGDPIIMKSDGYPTYHFANVVDDHFMKITHVLRGVEWQISTTKHILMYRAFNWDPPKYGHLPLLLNADGSKLSKRQGDIKISYYRDSGIFPLALMNYITSSGGGFEKDLLRGERPKCFTIDELLDQFDIEKINTNSGKLMTDRLGEFNRLDLKRQLMDGSSAADLTYELKQLVKEKFSNRPGLLLQLNDDYIHSVLHWSSSRINTLHDLVSNNLMFLWTIPEEMPKNLDQPVVRAIESLNMNLTLDLNKATINQQLRQIAEDNNIVFKDYMHLLRKILSGLQEGPSVAEMIETLGRENTQKRLKLFLNKNKTS